MDDLIRRQDAIEALIQEFYSNVDDYISEKQAVHAIDSLPSAQFEERTEERTETHACDLISRNAALALVVKAIHGTDSEEIKDYLFGGLRKELWALPSADRPKGKWIPYLPEGLRYKCSECESKYDTPWHFCPNCGCYNGGR